ncbi:PAS domain-containing hybrid sensor histidine kinase/response regulator [Nitrospira lenta]|uniref:histidine kinase n=1 Tax=Nitrospira lenta TaxID=1436998 RepID=A0A330L579_9BACT|nr:PAS domain S-box protein [Nitrospira lenta]SPP64446.1 Histidine kinase (modular protein) [Nitrospira lenta]
MDVTGNLLFGSALLSGAALWGFVRERRHSLLQTRVIAATSASVLVTDASVPRHPIIQANPAFRLLTGYAESEILGQSTHFLNGSHTDRTAMEKIGLALQDSRACRVTVRHYRKNGTPFWNEITLSPVKNRAGTVIRFIWVMNDVTQRQQAEDALKHTHDPSHLLAEFMAEAILVIGEDNRIVYVNAAGIELLGATSPEQLVGNPLAAILPPDRQEAARHRLQRLRGSEEPRTSYEERVVCLDSHTLHKVIPVMVSASLVLWKGKASVLLRLSNTPLHNPVDATPEDDKAHLQSAQAIAHLGSWEWNILDQTELWSDEQCRIFGYEPGSLTPTYEIFKSALHPDDRDRVLTAVENALQFDTPYDVDCRIIRPSKDIRFVRCRGIVIRNETHQPIRMSGTVQDLTDYRLIEEIAKERDLQFQLVVESAPNGILLTSEDGTITLANATLEKIFGYGHGELIGHSVDILVPSEFKSTHADHRRSFFSSPVSRPMGAGREFLARRKDGTEISVEIGLAPLRTSTGVHVLATIVDISARKALDELLREKDALNQAVLDSLTAEVAVLDQAGQITAVNTAWRQFGPNASGESASISPGQNYLVSLKNAAQGGDATAQNALEGIEAVRAGTRDRFSLEYPSQTSTDARWFAMTVMPLHGPWDGLVVTHEDISARKQAEQEREHLITQTQHLQKMQAIGTLAGGIAHEFNNSLTAVLGFSELALKAISKDHKVRRHLDQIIAAGRKSRDLVHQLLTFSQQGRHLKRPLSLHILIKESLKLLRPLVPSWVHLNERIHVPTPPVSADSSQMHQMLLNLVENALRAMQKTGGTLTVALEEIQVAQLRVGPQARLEPGTYARLMVQDTGEGMLPEIQERIFDPFFTTKDLGTGCGMGLAVVHGIITAHGGTIFVDSAPGTGTTVEVYLPIIPAQNAPAVSPGTEEPLPQGHECVLFVDDEESLARFGGEMLESLGYYAVVRMSASEALQAFRMAPQRFDLLITDVTMPNMSGVALAKDCRLLRPDLPIILCSGSEHTLSAEAKQVQGLTKYVLKPLLLQDVARTIRQVLDQAASETPSAHQRYRELARELVEEHDAISPSR